MCHSRSMMAPAASISLDGETICMSHLLWIPMFFFFSWF
jgi:hypothetical protein